MPKKKTHEQFIQELSKIQPNIEVLEEIHKKFHSIYGYGNNTLEQWNEFINNLK